MYFVRAYGLDGFNGADSVTLNPGTTSYNEADDENTTFLHPNSFKFLNNSNYLETFSV